MKLPLACGLIVYWYGTAYKRENNKEHQWKKNFKIVILILSLTMYIH